MFHALSRPFIWSPSAQTLHLIRKTKNQFQLHSSQFRLLIYNVYDRRNYHRQGEQNQAVDWKVKLMNIKLWKRKKKKQLSGRVRRVH